MRRLLLFALLSGCVRAPITQVPSSKAPSSEVSRCRVEGSLSIGAGSALYVDAKSPARRARFTGHEVAARVFAVGERLEVMVAAPAHGPALRLRGYLEHEDAPMVVVDEVELVSGHVWISAGAPVRVQSHGLDRVVVVPRTIQRFTGLSREIGCEALALGRGREVGPQPLPKGASWAHLQTPKLVLHDASGAAVSSFGVDWPEGTSVVVIGANGPRSHVVLDDWVRLDGWIDTSALAPGEGADCDDCRDSILDIDDLCAQGGDGCPASAPLGRASREGVVVARPEPGAPAIGSYDEGAVLVVLEERNGFGRVVPKGGGFEGADEGLWVSLEDLAPF